MFQKNRREPQDGPLKAQSESPLLESGVHGQQTSPFTSLTTSCKVSLELNRLETLSAQLLGLIARTSKLGGSTLRSLQSKDLLTNEYSIRHGQIRGREDSIFVTDLSDLSIVRFQYKDTEGALIYLNNDQVREVLMLQVSTTKDGFKAKPRRIFEKYVINVSDTEIGVGDSGTLYQNEIIDLQLSSKRFGNKPWFEKFSNLIFKFTSGDFGVKPRPITEKLPAADLAIQLGAVNKILSDTISALENN